MPNLLQVVTDTDRRGAQVFATDLGAALASTGWAVRTVALARGSVDNLAVPALGPTRLHPRTLRALRLAAGGADVVAAHGSTTLPACALALAGSGTPFVYRQISDSLFWAPTAAKRLRVRLGLLAATEVVALWSGSARTLEDDFGVAPGKISVIPNGVPVERFGPLTPAERTAARSRFGLRAEDRVVMYIGALAPEKGVDLAVRAVARLGVHLLVVGDGPERTSLQRLAEQTAPGRVHLAGPIEEAREAYAAADVVVLPSRGGDSMPAVLIEAGLLGLPVVSTPIEGIVDIVQSGVTGELVAPDDVDALSDALARVLDDPSLASRYGQAARARCAQHFGIDTVARSWIEVLDRARSRR